MSWEAERTDPESRLVDAAPPDPEATQPEAGRKGGAVIALHSPTFAPAALGRERAAAPPAGREMGRTHWGATLLAGAAAGVVLLGTELVLAPIVQDTSIWAPVRLMASVLWGERALEPPLTFDAGMAVAGLLVHFAVCVGFAAILAPLLRWFERGPAALLGAAYGLLTYNLIFYAGAMVQPMLIYGRGTPAIVAHILFGVALAALYRTFAGAPEAPIPDPPPVQIPRSETASTG